MATLTVPLLLTAGCGAASPDRPPRAASSTPPTWATAPKLPPCPAGAATGGAQLPAVELSCLDGRSRLTLTHLPSRPFVVNLWASWCDPCRREAPRLAAAASAATGRVAFLGIDTDDDRTAALSFLHDFGIDYPQLTDAGSDVLHGLSSPGLPVTVAIDATGHIVYRRIGEISADQLADAVHAADPAAAIPSGATG